MIFFVVYGTVHVTLILRIGDIYILNVLIKCFFNNIKHDLLHMFQNKNGSVYPTYS